MNSTIDGLVRDGLLEEVVADPRAARQIIEESRRHVTAAQRIEEIDRSGAYVLCYDAARKALSAVLLHAGYRAMAVPGSHTAIAKIAVSLGTTQAERSRLRQLNQMRQHRNRSEYGVRSFSAQETKAAIELAAWIIEFAATRLS